MISLPASRIVAGLTVTMMVLLLLHLLVAWSYFAGIPIPGRRQFFFDEENNIPTFFSTLMLLFASVLAACVAVQAREAREPFASHWRALGLVLLAMATDEVASLHEGLIVPLRAAFHIGDGPGPLRFAWVLAGIVAVVGFLIAFWRFVWQLPPRTRRRFIAGAVVYVAGAIGFEMVGGNFYPLELPAVVYWNHPANRDVLISMLFSTMEETLEMVGLLLAIDGLLGLLREKRGALIASVS